MVEVSHCIRAVGHSWTDSSRHSSRKPALAPDGVGGTAACGSTDKTTFLFAFPCRLDEKQMCRGSSLIIHTWTNATQASQNKQALWIHRVLSRGSAQKKTNKV